MPFRRAITQRLAKLEPRTVLAMHGSIFRANGAAVLWKLDLVLQN